MKTNMKCMGVVAALAIVVWGVPTQAFHNGPEPAIPQTPQWTFATSFDEGLILSENFEGLSPGDNINDGALFGAFNGTDFLVGNDNPDLNGNHFDGNSGSDFSHVFTFDDSPADHGAPSTGSYYIEGTVDNIGKTSVGVWNSAHNTQYNISAAFEPDREGFGWGFGPNGGAHSGMELFDPTTPIRSIAKVNVEGGFVTSYSFLAVDLTTGSSWGHGGQDGIPNHLPGFGTPTLRLFYDRRAGQNTDMDDFRIATMPWLPVIPEPTSFALLGLGSLLMLRRRV